jgi:hypothetical protein
MKKIASALVALATLVAFNLNASAATGVILQAATGHPYQTTSWTGYTLMDGAVTLSPSKAFVIPVPLDPTVSATYTVTLSMAPVQKDLVGIQEASVWLLDKDNNATYGCSLGNRATVTQCSLSVGSYKSMFVRITALSSYGVKVNSVYAVR